MAHVTIHHIQKSQTYYVQNHRAPNRAVSAVVRALQNCPARLDKASLSELLIISFHVERVDLVTYLHKEIHPRFYFPVNLTALGEILQCFRLHLPQFAGNQPDIMQAAVNLQSLIFSRTRPSSPDTW